MSEQGLRYWVRATDTPRPAPNGDWRIGPLLFNRSANPDGLTPAIIDSTEGGGKAIRLAVQARTYSTPDPADNVNDRCELRETEKTPLGAESWYGFSARVPRDFPIEPLRCVIAQVKMPFDDKGGSSPAFALRIDEGQWVATVEHLYEKVDADDHRFLSGSVDGACGIPAALAYDHHDFSDDPTLRDLQVRAVLATDWAGLPPHLKRYEFTQCTTGVKLATFSHLPPADGRWSDFILRATASAKKDTDGVVELYCDGALIARAEGEIGYATPDLAKSQYFKIGPYRNNDPAWGAAVAAIEVRDIRRGTSKREVELPGRAASAAPARSARSRQPSARKPSA